MNFIVPSHKIHSLHAHTSLFFKYLLKTNTRIRKVKEKNGDKNAKDKLGKSTSGKNYAVCQYS